MGKKKAKLCVDFAKQKFRLLFKKKNLISWLFTINNTLLCENTEHNKDKHKPAIYSPAINKHSSEIISKISNMPCRDITPHLKSAKTLSNSLVTQTLWPSLEHVYKYIMIICLFISLMLHSIYLGWGTLEHGITSTNTDLRAFKVGQNTRMAPCSSFVSNKLAS